MEQYYPMMIDLTHRQCLVVGGGQVAERKVLVLLKSGAKVRVVSPKLTPALVGWTRSYQNLEWRHRTYHAVDGEGCFLVIAATDQSDVNRLVYEDAVRRGQWINVVDQPILCNFTVPSIVRRGKLQIAISTGGASPALSKQIRKQLERVYGDEYEQLLTIMEELRAQLKRSIPDAKTRHGILKQLMLDSDTWLEVCRRNPERARDRIWEWVMKQNVGLSMEGKMV